MGHRLVRGLAAMSTALSLALAPAAAQVRADETTSSVAVHIVEAGETLSQIADGVGTDAASLAKLNGLNDANVLAVGQSLKLPPKGSAAGVPVVTSARPSASGGRTYTVAEGDTLWAIAQQFSTTTAQLVDANKLDDADHLSLGAHLLVPGGAASPAGAPAAPPTATPARAAGPTPSPTSATSPARSRLLVSYTVQPGQTLNQIARQFDVTADAIAQASSIDDPNRIAMGSVLKVPLPGRQHVVAAGETLRDIAQLEKVDLGTLIDFNQLDDPELIRIGQVVQVPAQPNLPAAATSPTSSPAGSAPPEGTIAAASTGSPASASAAVGSKPTSPQTSLTQARSAQAASAPAPAAPKPAPAKPPVAPLAVVAPPRGAPTAGLVGAGLKLLGSPYVWGGSAPSGFDCSGFVWYVARQVGKPLSRGMFGEYNSGSHPARDELKPGDLVFFQNTFSPGLSHNGIYIGDNQFVHAADESAGVTISSLGAAYWSSHWFGATRLP